MTKNYSNEFIQLLKNCLNPQPNHRLTLAQASEQLSIIRKSMKSVTYCIRLQEDEEKSKKQSNKR